VLNYLPFKKFLISCLISPKSPCPGFSNLGKGRLKPYLLFQTAFFQAMGARTQLVLRNFQASVRAAHTPGGEFAQAAAY